MPLLSTGLLDIVSEKVPWAPFLLSWFNFNPSADK